MKKKNGFGGKLLLGAAFLFLYLPIFVLIVFSFNSSASRTVWSGFTLDWYKELFTTSRIINSLYVTLGVAVLSSVIATIFGTFAAVGFFNMKKRWRNPLLTVNNIPVVNADIITGVSMCMLFVLAGSLLGTEMGFGTLLIAHISFNIPYVILSVMPKLYQLDKNLFEAAQDLGCTWLRAFVKVIIPEIMPGIINGLLIAFTMSVDDFVISYFTAGSNVETLSMVIYAMTRRRVKPTINAISTILFVVVLALLVAMNVRSARQERREQKRRATLTPGA